MLILENKQTQQAIVSNETIGHVFNQAFGLDINEVNDFVKQTQTNEIKNQIKVDFDILSKSNPSTRDIQAFNKTRAKWLANAGNYKKLRDTTLQSIAKNFGLDCEILDKSKKLTREWLDNFVGLGNKNFVLKVEMNGETKWISVKDGQIEEKWLEVQDTHKTINSLGLRVVNYHWMIKAIIG